MKTIFLLMLLLSTFSLAKPLKLALNWKAEPQFGGFYAAQVEGYFTKQGLEVEIIEGGSGTPTIQMLGAKQVEFSVVSGDEILMGFDRGNDDLRAIFSVYQTNPQSIMIHKDEKIKSLNDLFARKDLTLLWQAGLPYALYFKEHYKPFVIQTAPYQGGIGLFQNNKNYAQQCFETSEPLAARKAGLNVQTFLVAESGYNPYTTVLAVRKTYQKQNPEVVKKFRQAVADGWVSYLKDPTKTNLFMAKLNKSMDADTFSQSAKAQIPLIQTEETQKNGLGSMTQVRWETLISQLVQLKLIKKIPKSNEIFQ